MEELITFENKNTIVLYNDGSCESLELAIDTRKEDKSTHKAIVDTSNCVITKPAYLKVANGKILMTYFTKSVDGDEVYLVCFKIDNESLQIYETARKCRVARDDGGSRLNGYAVVDGIMGPSLISICKSTSTLTFIRQYEPNIDAKRRLFVRQLYTTNY